MAATMQHCSLTNNTPSGHPPPAQLKRMVYSKYRELLGSYNDQANTIIEALPAYMVRQDNGFNLDKSGEVTCNAVADEDFGGRQQGYEAPACVQNAMMTKDKKPFTYTPGGIDLSQIKSDRMAKRLARNAQIEGVTGASQQNRPTQPSTPPTPPGNMTASMGAAALGMPFQVLPPPPPVSPLGKKLSNGAPAPPPPPPSLNNTQQNTLAPPNKNGTAPGSPNTARKAMPPQRFEPPPLGFRPEIKIPSNPMAGLRKVAPPVEKNTFWKDEYVKDRSKSPMPEDTAAAAPPAAAMQPVNDNATGAVAGPSFDAHDGNACSSSPNKPSLAASSNGNDDEDGYQPTKTNYIENTETVNKLADTQPAIPKPQLEPPKAASPQLQQIQKPSPAPSPAPSLSPAPTASQTATLPLSAPQETQSKLAQDSARSVATPSPASASVFSRQTESPRLDTATPPQQPQMRVSESPFRFAQQQQQQRVPQNISPLAQPQQTLTPSPATMASASPQPNAAVPWRTARSQPSPPHQVPIQQQGPQGYQGYQGPKPTNVGSLYIAPLASTPEPQAQNLVRQQQQQYRESPMRQMQPQPGQAARAPATNWMRTQPQREQPEWARGGDEDGNVVPSSLNRMKSPPPAAMPYQQQQAQQRSFQATAPSSYQDQSTLYQTPATNNGNGFGVTMNGQNFGAHMTAPTGLRLQINTQSLSNNNGTQNGPREHIIPIQLEQTPTYSPTQPSFNAASNFGAPAGYVLRSPNQFVDQGYNNYNTTPQQQQQQRVMSPTYQLNAPRMIQQQQQQQQPAQGGTVTRIVPISFDDGNATGNRGAVSQSPVVIQSDPRSPPVQSKSFRILQQITATADDGESNSENGNNLNGAGAAGYIDEEAKLYQPQFARQMSAQQARNSPTIEQMRKMQISQQQQQPWTQQQGGSTNRYNTAQQRPAYNNDMQQQYIPASQQQVPEPKIYTGSAIPSRSFKILQAMTTPENAGPGQSDL